jgi:predicted O-methyltransferase YrrM
MISASRRGTLATLAFLSLALASCSQQPTAASESADSVSSSAAPDVQADQVASVLEAIRAKDAGQLAISEEDGRFLRVLVAANRSRRVLEIGAASGYSAIWIGLGLHETGGHMTTIESDPVRAREAAENIRKTGLSDVVTVIRGDAFKEIPKLEGTFDFVFLDAGKKDYKKFLDMVLPRVDAHGLFLAHNVVNKRDEMGDFLDAITRDPNLWTAIVTPSGEGISVSYKRR